ncbi:copper amine oxidase [Paenibacillus cisolokensis]|uniref:copper amine oxidase n=1 Tax=Paenibacillus cisolokensis TaxID=1658519 RepID=UPI003D2713CB
MMKKWMYLLLGTVFGVFIALGGTVFADQVNSLIGKKVTGEMTVIVNGKELSEKGAVINGRTNAPVRAVVDAVGGELKLEGKTIHITTASEQTHDNSVLTPNKDNKYLNSSKSDLEELKNSILNNRIKPAVEERAGILKEIEILKTSGPNGTPAPGLIDKQKQLDEYNTIIANAEAELELVEAALAALNK